MLPLTVLSPFLLIPAAVWLGRRPARQASLLALWPVALALYFGWMFRVVAASGPVEASLPWAQTLGLTLSFYADGLSLLFALLITGIGALIVIFSSRYFDGDPRAGRFQATLFAFMGSMLGVALSNNLLALFVFWELTGFTSFLLIGFDHERKEARASAIQALLVTGMGGMGLLAAALLVEQAAGTLSLSKLLAGDASLRQTETYPAIVTLVLLAAFTKSAQAPFHFWLPNAMTAPTPVSAYLHSATMVKAGVYLVARMTPLLGATPLWTSLVIGAGAITMALGAWRSVAETDLKRVLAYSTVSALGILMMLLGLGTKSAVTAALVYLVAHACYKGTLFLVAGTLEHETGTRDVTALGGLRNSMPTVAMAGGLAACSMAGVPLFLGFVGKELLYGALWGHGEWWMNALVLIAVGASALLGAAGLTAGVAPFFGPPGSAVVTHRVPAALAVPSLILATAGLMAGLLAGSGRSATRARRLQRSARNLRSPSRTLAWLYSSAGSQSVYACSDSVTLQGSRLRAATHLAEITRLRAALYADVAWSRYGQRLVPPCAAKRFVAVIRSFASRDCGRAADSGLDVGAAATLASDNDHPNARSGSGSNDRGRRVLAVRAKSTITAVLSLGVVGYGVALTYLFFGAPDLAMTQFSVETLTAVIFVLVFYHFRAFGSLSPWRERARDASVAVLFGSSIAVILLFVGASVTPLRLADYYAEMGPRIAHGRNIVNVILVDFRALDTLGEITVLATAAIGVRAILR